MFWGKKVLYRHFLKLYFLYTIMCNERMKDQNIMEHISFWDRLMWFLYTIDNKIYTYASTLERIT
jgi:hypothetical protein